MCVALTTSLLRTKTLSVHSHVQRRAGHTLTTRWRCRHTMMMMMMKSTVPPASLKPISLIIKLISNTAGWPLTSQTGAGPGERLFYSRVAPPPHLSIIHLLLCAGLIAVTVIINIHNEHQTRKTVTSSGKRQMQLYDDVLSHIYDIGILFWNDHIKM